MVVQQFSRVGRARVEHTQLGKTVASDLNASLGALMSTRFPAVIASCISGNILLFTETHRSGKHGSEL